MDLVNMKVLKKMVVAVAAMGIAAGADFSIQIGNPVAANATTVFKVKNMLLSVRAQDCADAAKTTFTGSALRLLGGKRESAALTFVAGSAPGSYAVVGGWPVAAVPWIAVITGECLGAKAGALIPVNVQGSYVRETSRFVGHAPTDAEIEAALKTTTGGLR